MDASTPTALTAGDLERPTPRTMTCLMSLGFLLVPAATLATFDDYAIHPSLYYDVVSARNDLDYRHEPFGTSLSVVDSPAFDNFIAIERELVDPTVAFSYVKSLAFLPIDEAADVAADKYFAKKSKKPRKVVISTRA